MGTGMRRGGRAGVGSERPFPPRARAAFAALALVPLRHGIFAFAEADRALPHARAELLQALFLLEFHRAAFVQSGLELFDAEAFLPADHFELGDFLLVPLLFR